MPNTEFIDDCERLAELAPVVTAPIQHHVFVCTGKSCSAVESAEVKAAFEEELKARGLQFGTEKKVAIRREVLFSPNVVRLVFALLALQ